MRRVYDEIPENFDPDFDPDGKFIENYQHENKLNYLLEYSNFAEWRLKELSKTRNKKEINPTNYTRLRVCILTALSTILTVMLICCYEFPNRLETNLRSFAIAMICITSLFFLLSILICYFKGIGDDPKNYKKIAIIIFLVVEVCDIVGSVLIFLKV
jgi:hypothetical protein